MEEILLWLLRGLFLIAFAAWDGAIAMWLLGGVFPVLSYLNWVGLAFAIICCVGSGIALAKMD